MPTLPKEEMRNWLIPWFLRLMKLPMNEPIALGVEVLDVARSMRSPVPEKVPLAWVMAKREVVASRREVVPMV